MPDIVRKPVFCRRMTALLAAAVLGAAASDLGSETYRLITYYPAPYGSYKKFQTTDFTILARDRSKVLIGKAKSDDTGDAVKLEVGGAILIGGGAAAGVDGAIRYTAAGHFEGFYDGEWHSLEGGGISGSGTSPGGENVKVDISPYGYKKAPRTVVIQQQAVRSASSSYAGYYNCGTGVAKPSTYSNVTATSFNLTSVQTMNCTEVYYVRCTGSCNGANNGLWSRTRPITLTVPLSVLWTVAQ